jgi:hypothetical protein
MVYCWEWEVGNGQGVRRFISQEHHDGDDDDSASQEAVSGLALRQATTQNRWPRRVCLAEDSVSSVVLACRARSSRLRLLLSCRKLTQLLDTIAAPLTSSLSFVIARSLTTTTTARIHTSLHRISLIVTTAAHGKHRQ